MMELTENPFMLAPVVVVLPGTDELPQVGEIGAGVPTCACDLLRPARIFQAQPQVVQDQAAFPGGARTIRSEGHHRARDAAARGAVLTRPEHQLHVD